MEEKRPHRNRRRFVKRTVEREEKIKVSTEYLITKYRVLADAISNGALPPFAAILRKALDDNYDRVIKRNGKSTE